MQGIHDVIIIPVLFEPLNLQTHVMLRKKITKKLYILRTKTALV